MAKRKAFTEADLTSMGLVQGERGVWEKPKTYSKEQLQKLSEVTKQPDAIKKGRPSSDEVIYKDHGYAYDNPGRWVKRTVILIGYAPSMNSGLMHMHWTKLKKLKDLFKIRVMALNLTPINGEVKLTYIRYSPKQMDIDNGISTMKIPLDAIKNCKIIEDDSGEVIKSFHFRQEKCRRKDARMEFLIEKL